MTLQLDNNLISIRERNLLEIMDLALIVLRTQGWPLLMTLLIGAVPMLLINDLLTAHLLELDPMFEEFLPVNFLLVNALLVCIELPLASAPATLYLGQSMFQEQTRVSQLFRDFWTSLPQMFWLQGVLRGIFVGLFMFLLPPIIPFIAWPYLNEIILLERNPLLPKKGGRLTTFRRSRMLHGGNAGDLLGRWLGSVLIGTLLGIAVWMSLWVVLSQLAGGWISWEVACRWFLPIAIWTVVCFFVVVRFLAYLDLRMRREGWEVELAMRAEAAQLVGGSA